MVNLRAVKWLFALALLLRLAMLTLEPFSTDTNRFFADGLNTLNGKNPYTAPAPIEIKYANLRSFYPPLQEAFFAAATAVWPSPKVFRLLGGLAEIVFLFWFFGRKRNKRMPHAVALFLLFNPISIHEIWREGHLDHIGVFALYFAIVSRGWRRYLWAFASIGWKFVGVFAAAFVPARRGAFFVVFCATAFAVQIVPAIVYTPFAESGLTVYKTYWHHGNGIIHLFERFGFAAAHGIYFVQVGLLALFGIVGILFLRKRMHRYDAVWFSLGSLLVLFPVQHPWYYFLLFPAVLLSPRWRNLAVSICCLTPLTYLGYIEQYKSLGFFAILIVWMLGCHKLFTRHTNKSYR